ncbi:MAG: hypothetical protein M3357_07955 [Actinomycetota bacterium]|nr:hypothetical protein [Actinomycetota bacterium]
MTGWRDLDVVRQPLPLDDWTADRLLAGMVDPDDAPPGYAGLARALGQARGPVEAGELSGRELIVAAVTAAVADVSPPTTVSTSPRRKSMFTRLFGTKLAAATLTTALLATGAAAATGSLPGPVRDAVSGVADVVGVTLPDAASDTAELHVADEAERAARKAAHQADLADQKAQKAAEKILHQGEVDARQAENGAEVVEEQGTPASDEGVFAHRIRDLRHEGAENWKAERDTRKSQDPAGDDTQLDEDKDTPASTEGAEAHARRDTHLGTVAAQKAERDALKAERPADADDAADDQGDDVADADDDAGEKADDDADDDEDKAGKEKGEHEDDEDEVEDDDDDPVTQPTV